MTQGELDFTQPQTATTPPNCAETRAPLRVTRLGGIQATQNEPGASSRDLGAKTPSRGKMRVTAKDMVLVRLKQSRQALAVHEFDIQGYSENNIATRLSELAREGLVKGNRRDGRQFKEWSLIWPEGVMAAHGVIEDKDIQLV